MRCDVRMKKDSIILTWEIEQFSCWFHVLTVYLLEKWIESEILKNWKFLSNVTIFPLKNNQLFFPSEMKDFRTSSIFLLYLKFLVVHELIKNLYSSFHAFLIKSEERTLCWCAILCWGALIVVSQFKERHCSRWIVSCDVWWWWFLIKLHDISLSSRDEKFSAQLKLNNFAITSSSSSSSFNEDYIQASFWKNCWDS